MSKRYKLSGSSSFNPEFGDASINLNNDSGDDDEDEVQEVQRPVGKDKAKSLKKKGIRSSGTSTTTNDEALARMMISELTQQNERAIKMKKKERLEFLEIKKREVEMQKYKAHQKDLFSTILLGFLLRV